MRQINKSSCSCSCIGVTR